MLNICIGDSKIGLIQAIISDEPNGELVCLQAIPTKKTFVVDKYGRLAIYRVAFYKTNHFTDRESLLQLKFDIHHFENDKLMKIYKDCRFMNLPEMLIAEHIILLEGHMSISYDYFIENEL